MQVLVALARRRGQVVSRDQLIETCWAGRVVGEDAINRCIAKVRRLGETHGAFSLETIARVGHRLTEQAGEQPVTVESVAPAPSAKRRPRWMAALAVVVVVVAVGAYVGIAQMRARERAQETAVLTQIAALVDKDQYGAAFALAYPLSRDDTARANPAFAELWRTIVVPMKPLVAQEGASVSFKAYDDPDGAWIAAGATPLQDWVDAPRGAFFLLHWI
jgi:DNA-binding winged helix-turn-helix (wHTH) protein